MIESAAHLVDHVFPEVPIRQWVLTFPIPLRFLFAARPEVLNNVLAVVQRGISTFIVRQAGLQVSSGARTGAVTLIQRFGSALNLNIHLHMLFVDGAYSFSGRGAAFHRARRPTDTELAQLLDALCQRIVRVLERRGLLIADPVDPYLDLEPGSGLDQIQAASIAYRIAIGPHAGRKALVLYSLPPLENTSNRPLVAQVAGFSLHAATVCEAWQRSRLERLCRYVTRPPIATKRLYVDDRGRVVYQYKHPFRDGSTHVLLEPLDFIARLAALVPRPRLNLTRFHGIFAPNFKHRARIVPDQPRGKVDSDQPTAPMSWAQRLKRVFQIDIETCPECGGKLRVIACTRHGYTRALLGLRPNRTLVLACAEDPPLIAKILAHVQQHETLIGRFPRAPPDSQPLLNLT